MAQQTRSSSLVRTVGLPGAVLMGMGSILGTGVFVSIGIAAGVAGPAVVLAVALAAVVATCNGLSSAQLAASHPVSGGTYEYGYRYLNPELGFVAGWMFLCAKSASAATAALGFAGYVLTPMGFSGYGPHVVLGLVLVAALTGLVAHGIRGSNRVNAAIVSFTLAGLAAFVLAGAPRLVSGGAQSVGEMFGAGVDLNDLLHGTALMFVAYTGYGRIATLGEEVRDPARTIPRAIVATLFVTMALYVSVAAVAIAVAGAPALALTTSTDAAPLGVVAQLLPVPGLPALVGLAAITAMVGVLLNLILGLSRVALAMGRRGDLPAPVAGVREGSGSPVVAVLLVGVIVAGLVTVGSVRTTWEFSAFTVLVYYALTNLAALRLPAEQRRFPRAVSVLGLASTLGLAFWVDRGVWISGLGLIAAGLLWHRYRRSLGLRSGG